MDSNPLLSPKATTAIVLGALNHRAFPASRSTSGGWTSALFIIGAVVTERIAYWGVATNLITYLTGSLGEDTAAAAANVNAWGGFSSMLPIVTGFVADKWFGRYNTILAASVLYILGFGMLTLSAVVPSLHPPKHSDGSPFPATVSQNFFFYTSLYLIALGQGAFKPCMETFGADQFDENDPEERKSKSSYFNWWHFGICSGTSFTPLVLVYIQDNISWGIGFGIPFVSMALALLIFLLGTETYRYYVTTSKSRFGTIGKAVERVVTVEDEEEQQIGLHQEDNMRELLKLFPIWATSLVFAVVFAQTNTFFTKQGSTMDRRVGPTLQVPAAAFQGLIFLSILAFIPIYDRVFVPIVRNFTGIPSGITMLQRIGIGFFLSMVSMVVAALVEIKRLQTAKDLGLIDLPKATIPMSLWWLIPQYVLFGVADVFALVGLEELFYDQVPVRLRSIGMSLCVSIFGIGGLISSFLVSAIDKASTSSRGGESWFPNNLNRGHLDYFYWLLAGLSGAQVLIYLYFSKTYVYKKTSAAAT